MAGGSRWIWIPLLLSCIFPPSDNSDVRREVITLRGTGNSQLEDILSKIPIKLPEGINPQNINVTSVTIKTCTGAKEQLELLSRQLKDTTLHNRQLDEEAFGLRRDVRLLKLQLDTCSSTASAITGSYQTQLLNEMKQLLGTTDSDTFLVLKFIPLTREVQTLQKRINLAANFSETAAEIPALQSELQEKMNALNAMKKQIGGKLQNSSLIFEIISLQNLIWDIEQEELRRGETGLQQDKRLPALQAQLDRKFRELRDKGDATSAMLELISVHSKIATMQKLLSIYTEKSRTNAADYQRQFRQKTELLKQKILQLNREDSNTDLTKEILILQAEVEQFRQLWLNTKRITDSRLRELVLSLVEEKKRQENLQKLLEQADQAQSEVILKVINIMKDVRELQSNVQQQTSSPHQATTLQAVLQAKERQYTKAQADIEELQSRLRLKSEECSGLEERYRDVKTEFDQKVAELNRTGDAKAALIMNFIHLNDKLKTLEGQISTTKDPARKSELQRQVEETQVEANSKLKVIERNAADHKTIFTIIELLNRVWDLQKQPTNEPTSDRMKELQDRVEGFISELDDRGNENTKLILQMLMLQSQVMQLQKELTDAKDLRTSTVTQLRNELTDKKKELQQLVNEKNQTNARLILKITNLHDQLRNLEEEWRNDNATSSLTVKQLRGKLRENMVEHSRDQAEIKELQRRLQLKSQECSGLEEKYRDVKTEFDQKVAELNRTGNAKAALILNVINLKDELKNVEDQISKTKDPDRKSELLRQLEEKQEELNSNIADVERLIDNPKIILTILQLQDEIWDLQKQAPNETTANRIKDLQDRVDGLLGARNDIGDDNTKLMLKIMTLQSQVDELQRQLSVLQMVKTARVTELENELNTKKNELKTYVDELNEKSQANAKLILTVTDLNKQLRDIQEEKQNAGVTASATITKLKEELKIKVQEHVRDQSQIKDLESKLNQTEAQCSTYEQEIKDLQNDLDAKMTQLQSKSDSVTSLALQVSTSTLQLEELKRQLQNTDSKAKIKELQKQIDEKNIELAKKTEELKTRSAQPERLLQIIAIQTEIEKLVNVAANDTDFTRITMLQDHLNYLVGGIQDETDENTKLVFQIMNQQDEIARLKKQEEKQTKAQSENIKNLENELEDIRNQIAEKTQLLDSSDVRITNLSAQIMDLHKKIQPLEDEISFLKETHAENIAELQKRLSLTKRQLQDSEVRLKDADTKNFDLIMEIANLRTELKKTKKEGARAAAKNINELEEQLQTQQRETKKLENTNRDLKQEVKELKMCCNDDNTHCEDVQRQLQQSQEDADRLQQQLQERDTSLEQLQQQIRDTDRLQLEYSDLERALNQSQDHAHYLQEQLNDKDAMVTQLQQELEQQTAEHYKLQEELSDLQNKKSILEETVQDLQNQISDVEDKTIHTRTATLNPDTAHPRVVLSADNTAMSTTDEIQNVPDYPGRFDVALAVLGSTGYSTGRHYWEVSVADKNCYHLGMASESAPRKGTLSFKPHNGYWTIILNKQGEMAAIDKKRAPVTVQRLPLTLGILLDYKKGQISFYDAGARTHLYSFVGQQFTDKIYPFINFCVEDTGNETPIVLVAPGSVSWIQ